MRRSSFWKQVYCGKVLIVEARILWKGPHCGSKDIVERSSLWKLAYCDKVIIVEASILQKCTHYGSHNIVGILMMMKKKNIAGSCYFQSFSDCVDIYI